ncbi:hypothetical protein [Mangrovicoccus sp. HB161399]|uniref:hypothetical protein n=1 Tax=Mangrovicoccus sp. HB161399 TaxID=2720392 RepID=UPI001554263C|nr:hypothetical protein [Mangrovicoccus sp. HB161399]
MTEELRPGFQIKTAVLKAIEDDDAVAEIVQRTLAQLDIGPPRGAGPEDRAPDPDAGFDPGFDTDSDGGWSDLF